MDEGEGPGLTAPHPVVAKFYAERAERLPFVRNLFNETAASYDRINWLFSLGSGAWYRRRCLIEAGLKPGLRVVDVAVGTGLLAQEAVTVTGTPRDVIGIDLSEAMLAVAQEKLAIPLVQGTADALPLADAVTDFVTMGFALRHVSDLVIAFREFHRVLRPGGTVLLLEIGKPSRSLTRLFASAYLGRVVPFLCRLTTAQARTRTLMEYYWETIEGCVPPEVILEAMRNSGFGDPQCKTELDLFRCYTGRKK